MNGAILFKAFPHQNASLWLLRAMLVLGVLAAAVAVASFWWGASLLYTLSAEHLSFVELGAFGSTRTLDPLAPFFQTHHLPDYSALAGVSSAGDRLLILADSHRMPKGPQTPKIYDELDVTTLDRKVVTRFLPAVYRMLAYSAELSPDGQSVGFVGNFITRDGHGGYGLHLLKSSGEIRTFVATTEPQTPQSIGWSGDGRTIVYDLDGHVLWYNIDTNHSYPLTEGSRPTWSPDREWIAYRRSDGGAALIHPDGNGQRNILDNVQLGWGLRWSPDSRYLLYSGLASES